MNTANKITLVRIILIPIILILMLLGSNIAGMSISVWSLNFNNDTIKISIFWIIAGILFIFAAFSDWLDGYLARKYNQVTNFGKIFDPIADKMLVNGVIIVMTVASVIPIWITLILILRDIFIDGLRIFVATKQIVIAANFYGKIKTFLQLVALTLLFFINHLWFGWSSSWTSWQQHLILLPLYFAVLFSLLSASIYFYTVFKILKHTK